MKPKVWNEEEAKTADKDQLFFKLIACPSHGDMIVTVVDKDDNRITGGDLIMFEFDLGCLVIFDGINPIVPLKTGLDNDLLYMEEYELKERMNVKKHQMFLESILKSKQENIEPVSTH